MNHELSQFKMAPFTISYNLIGSNVIVLRDPELFNNFIRNLHSMNEFYR